MSFKLVRKTIFEQTYNFCVIICFCFRWIYKSLRRKSDFILFCIFNYVTCINLLQFSFLIFLSVNFSLPGEDVVTSTI